MANIAIFEPNKTPVYLKSVSEGPYVVDINVNKNNQVAINSTILINPDISAVVDIPLKYWKKDNSSIVEMSIIEKAVVDAAELASRKLVADNYNVESEILLTALIKVVNLRLTTEQKITKLEMITALKDEII